MTSCQSSAPLARAASETSLNQASLCSLAGHSPGASRLTLPCWIPRCSIREPSSPKSSVSAHESAARHGRHAARRRAMSGIFRPVTIDDSPPLLEAEPSAAIPGLLPGAAVPQCRGLPEPTGVRRVRSPLDSRRRAERRGRARWHRPDREAQQRGFTVLPSLHALPRRDHLAEAGNTVVEISRVCIARRYTRRRGDAFFDAPDGVESDEHAIPRVSGGVAHDDVFATLVKAVYHATKRLGATHWIVAIEKSAAAADRALRPPISAGRSRSRLLRSGCAVHHESGRVRSGDPRTAISRAR